MHGTRVGLGTHQGLRLPYIHAQCMPIRVPGSRVPESPVPGFTEYLDTHQVHSTSCFEFARSTQSAVVKEPLSYQLLAFVTDKLLISQFDLTKLAAASSHTTQNRGLYTLENNRAVSLSGAWPLITRLHRTS